MKRLLIAGILATLTLFAGCSSATESQENETYNSPEIEEAEDVETEESEININDFVITGQLQEPDSIGTIYYQATLTNNSSYPSTVVQEHQCEVVFAFIYAFQLGCNFSMSGYTCLIWIWLLPWCH